MPRPADRMLGCHGLALGQGAETEGGLTAVSCLTVGSTSWVLREEKEGAAGRTAGLSSEAAGRDREPGVRAPQKLLMVGLGASRRPREVHGPAFTPWAHLGLPDRLEPLPRGLLDTPAMRAVHSSSMHAAAALSSSVSSREVF